MKRPPRTKKAPARRPPAITARQLFEAFLEAPVAAGVAHGDRVLRVNHPFAAAVGRKPALCEGSPLGELLPPESGGEVELPEPGRPKSYRTRLDGVAARVDLSASGRGKRRLVGIALRPVLDDVDTAQSRTLLSLSRDLAAAYGEEELADALERALDALFPGRSFCLRLLDARTLATTAFRARGRLRPEARDRVALRRSAVKKIGLAEPSLTARGLTVTEADEPAFERCRRALAVPLAASGELFGVVDLEYEADAPGAPESDEPLLLQVANQAALALRNLRSLREVTYLKGFLEDLLENANALIAVVNRERKVMVFTRALSNLVGRRRQDVLGGELAALVPDRERRPLAALLERTFAGEAAAGVELSLLVVEEGGAARLAAEREVVGDGERRHEHELLVHDRDARVLGVARRHEAALGAEHAHRALVRVARPHAGEDLQDGRLAGAVLAAQAQDLARPRGEVSALQRLHAAERFDDPCELEDDVAHARRLRQ